MTEDMIREHNDKKERSILFKKLSHRKYGQERWVKELVEQVLPLRNVVEYGLCISAFAKVGMWQKAQQLLGEMKGKGIEPNVVTYTAAISACRVGAKWERALELLCEMKASGLKPNLITYSVVMSVCKKSGQWKRSLELLDELKGRGLTPDLIIYNGMISVCAEGGEWERSLELLEEVKGVSGLEPNVITYSSAISACEKGRKWERALELLEELKERGLKPDLITYNTAISACATSGKWERALKLLLRLDVYGPTPDVVTYNATITACEIAGEWERALELVDQLKERELEPNLNTYNAAIRACASSQKLAPAVLLFEEVEASSSCVANRVTFNALLDVAWSEQPELAQRGWREAVARGLYVESYASSFTFDIGDHSAGAAATALRWWLGEGGVLRRLQEAGGDAPEQLTIVTGGKSRSDHQAGDLRVWVLDLLRQMDMQVTESQHNPDCLHIDTTAAGAALAVPPDDPGSVRAPSLEQVVPVVLPGVSCVSI